MLTAIRRLLLLSLLDPQSWIPGQARDDIFSDEARGDIFSDEARDDIFSDEARGDIFSDEARDEKSESVIAGLTRNP
jgi:hypothetical protein